MTRPEPLRRLWRWLRQDVLSANASAVVDDGRRSLERIVAAPMVARLRHEGPLGRRVRFEALAAVDPVAVAAQDGVVMVVSTDDGVLGKAVFARGSAEAELLPTVLSLLGRDRVGLLVDVGAHIGTVCVPALARDLAARAIAVEPDPDNLRLLHANLHLNGVADRARVVPAAASDTAGTVLLSRSARNHGDHRVGIVAGEERVSIEVSATTIDAVLAGEDLSDALVWMDVQGSEGRALAGATSLSGVPVVLELWPSGLGETASVMRSRLASASRIVRLDGASGPQALSKDDVDALWDRLTRTGRHADLLVLP